MRNRIILALFPRHAEAGLRHISADGTAWVRPSEVPLATRLARLVWQRTSSEDLAVPGGRRLARQHARFIGLHVVQVISRTLPSREEIAAGAPNEWRDTPLTRWGIAP